MDSADFKRKLTAILSADVVGYSRLMGDNEAATVKTLETYKGVMFSLIKQHRGRVVDSPGDNLLAEFGSVVDAVQCAVSIQKELQTRNAELAENRKMQFRIGINLGDVIEEQDRIYGDGVNIAARLEALADPGGICISKTAFDHIESKLPLGYEFLGDQNVKNIAKPVGAYKVLMETRVVDTITKREMEVIPFWRKKAYLSIGIIVILGIIAGLYWNFSIRDPSIDNASIETGQTSTVTDTKDTPKTIAVLPFDNLSSDPEQQYFVDGLTEEISISLEQIPKLTVIARASSTLFKKSNKTIQEIAYALSVDHILSGSIRRAGNTIRITVRLIKVSNNSTLWSETYDKEFTLKEILAIQEDIARNVANKLKLTLEAFQLSGGTKNIEAYENYLNSIGKGQEKIVSQGFDELEPWKRRLQFIDSAIDLDPEFALAYSERAYIHVQRSFRVSPNLVDMEIDSAIQAAEKAIELEPNLPGPYMSLIHIKMTKDNFIEAGNNSQKALRLLNGNVSDNENWLPGFYIAVGNFKRARELINMILKNDPLAMGVFGYSILNFALSGDLEGSEEEYENVMNMGANMDYTSWSDMCISFARIGTKKILTQDEIVYSNRIFDLGKEHLGSPEEGLLKLRKIYNDNPKLTSQNLTGIIIWAAFFGDPEFAMEVLEKSAKAENNTIIASYLWLPVMKDVRCLPRFKEYVREIGLVAYWKEYGWPDNNLCHPVNDDDFVCD